MLIIMKSRHIELAWCYIFNAAKYSSVKNVEQKVTASR